MIDPTDTVISGDGMSFLGFISDTPFTTVTFRRTDTGGAARDASVAFDRLEFELATAVPEPSSLLLAGLGLLAGAARRGRRP